MKKLAVLAIVVLSVLALAEDKKPDAKPLPTLTEIQQNKLLKAQHAKDLVSQKGAQLAGQWQQIVAQQREIQDRAKALDQEMAEANKALDAETDAAFKAAGLDKEKYTLDVEKMVFNPKISPAPVSQQPEKK